MRYLLIIFILLNSCTDILINDTQYNSVRLKGGAWIQFSGNDLGQYLSNDFTLQLSVSGDSNESNDGKFLLSIVDDNDDSVLFGLLRNTSVTNGLEFYLDGQLIDTITDDNLDWSILSFNLISIVMDSNQSKMTIFVNDIEAFSYDGIDLETGTNNLIIGAKVNTSQSSASNFWTGFFDEIRLWDDVLTADEISFHVSNTDKLISSSGCSDEQYTTLTLCEDAGETWSGIYSDQRLTDLIGLWRFNYNVPQSNVPDESCEELNLDSGVSNDADCNDFDGTIYTMPGYNVQFSTKGI